MIDSLFFELLQVAIGTRQSLSNIPSAKQWAELFALSKKQALVAVVFAGIKTLSTSRVKVENSGHASEDGLGGIGMDKLLHLKWLGLSIKVAQRNKVLNKECARLSETLDHDGFHCCILKGQSNLVYYPAGLKECRTAGDIDVLFRAKVQPEALDLPILYCQQRARLLGENAPHVTYHHADLAWEGSAEVEGHYRATFLCSSLRNRRMQYWLERNMPWRTCGSCDYSTSSDVKTGDYAFPVPTVSYNTIYQLLHIYKHLFEEGIGLRQLLDYYFVLNALHKEQKTLSGSSALPLSHEQQGQKSIKGERPEHWQDMGQWEDGRGGAVMSNEEIMYTLTRFGMKKFASAVMYVLQTVFAIPAEYLICEPDEKEGKFLLNEIMQAGNFGKYDDRIARGAKSFMGFKVPASISHAIEKTKHNLRLLMHYPEEVLWEPFFRVYHWIWRRFELWRF